MNNALIDPNIDPVRHDDLRALAELEGPVVSLLIPTHRGGPETVNDSRQLKPLLDDARTQLAENFPDVDADALLAETAALADDEPFWQRQADALAVFASPSGTRWLRTALEGQAQVSVGDYANLRPLLPLVADDQPFLLLAVSQDKVRLFEGDNHHLEELDLGEAPTSTDDSDYYTREPEFQHQTGDSAPAHGHSTGENVVRDSFLRDLAKSVNTRFTNDDRPLILASVDEHRGGVKDYLPNVQLLDDTVSGNPDQLSEAELHEKAWPLASAEADKRHGDLIERFGENLGTGKGTHDAAKISQESEHGRVDTLILTTLALRENTLGDASKAADLDAAVAHTLRNSGVVDVVPTFNEERAAGAIFRF
ncbi:hypothetical protein [Corynebacterium sp.]|uniref:baeRF3 domain-containing protein n=1 Tax=Corynebacterium sp. TaxID=1720 RepID=UPI0026E0F041|nr:hypothetical protein [Corynebacterium sp.]MDO5512811.1 hypothetical protein [Corynebacterium sp.]